MTASIRLSVFSLVFALVCGAATAARAAQAFMIIDSKTGYVFQERDSKKKLQIASLTKVATAMVVLDWAEKSGGDL
ncbi:MAG: hypothetical protein ABIR71_06665, partial [Chthoniobacterales bacterium]